MIVHSFFTNSFQYVKAKLYAISSDTHQLGFMKLHHFKLERFKLYGHWSPCLSISTSVPGVCASTIFKYADDPVLVGLTKKDEADYRTSVDHLITRCQKLANFLEVNVTVTREITI